MESQVKEILKHLVDYGKITSYEAFKEYGVTRLSAIIYILRNKHNMNIETIMKQTKNRYGNTCNYAEYKLMEIKND